MNKKIIGVTLLSIILLLFPITTLAMVEPTSEFYINDYANILSEEVKQDILNKSVALEKQTGAQIVVVTVPNLEGQSLEEYATELFRKFGIGDKNENGLLLLLALEERKFRVEVGYGLEGVLPDGLTGRYQDEYIIPYLKEDKWDEGIQNGYNAFYKKVAESYNLDVSDINVTRVNTTNTSEDFDFSSMIFLFIIAGILWGTTVFRKDRSTRITSPVVIIFALIFNIIPIVICYLNSISILIFGVMLEMFSLFSARYSNGSSSGYFGGRGSSGGGFGGFSGGGGLSGGGGSSRGF